MITSNQEEVRKKLKEVLEREKQTYIAKQLGVPRQVISAFKLGKKDLYPSTLEDLKKYLNM